MSEPRYITALRLLAAADGEGDAVYEKGGGMWLGFGKFSSATFFRLLRLCAISMASTNVAERGAEYFGINETGREILAAYDAARKSERPEPRDPGRS